MRRWIVLTAILTAGVSVSSGGAPYLNALAGTVQPSDFASNIAAARELAAGRDPYEADFAKLHAAVLGIPVSEGRPYFPHPPLAALLIRPWAPLSFRAAALIWFAVSVGVLFMLAVLLAEIVSDAVTGRAPGGGPRGTTVAMIFLGLLAWPPVLYNLEKGQWSILLSLLVALVWRSVARGHPSEAGAWAALAAAVKVFPALLVVYLLLRDRRAFVWFAVTSGVLFLIPIIWMGPGAFAGFLRHSAANLPYWETWLGVTYSLDGAAARLLIGGQWARPIVYAPMLARFLVGSAGVLLVAVAAWVAGRHQASDEREGVRFAAFAILLVVLNPLAMGHNGVLLALPIALVGHALVGEPRIWPKAAWAAGVVLASIPKETVFRLCPIPVSPVRGLVVVALPCWGALLLFAAAVGVALRRTSGMADEPAR
jgi:Glycosyltransferase family 87